MSVSESGSVRVGERERESLCCGLFMVMVFLFCFFWFLKLFEILC